MATKEKIITNTEDDVSADRLKNAAATKKLAIFDAFEILNRIQEEENILEGKEPEDKKERVTQSFGIGYKSNQYFFDFALSNSYEKEEYFMFNGSSATELSKTAQNLIFTFGYKF